MRVVLEMLGSVIKSASVRLDFINSVSKTYIVEKDALTPCAILVRMFESNIHPDIVSVE